MKLGEYGSWVPVMEKQRPQASPAPEPGAEPKESWLIAAVNPVADRPQAEVTSFKSRYLTQDNMDIPGDPQPEYIVKEAVPEGF